MSKAEIQLLELFICFTQLYVPSRLSNHGVGCLNTHLDFTTSTVWCATQARVLPEWIQVGEKLPDAVNPVICLRQLLCGTAAGLDLQLQARRPRKSVDHRLLCHLLGVAAHLRGPVLLLAFVHALLDLLGLEATPLQEAQVLEQARVSLQDGQETIKLLLAPEAGVGPDHLLQHTLPHLPHFGISPLFGAVLCGHQRHHSLLRLRPQRLQRLREEVDRILPQLVLLRRSCGVVARPSYQVLAIDPSW
mmetsp:Transcript_31169/g.58490  ORF Transcript_31169/g.58490 Transcript_31169/m.58490 type:complete len:247 (+) Transcript_31169:241-981(+)